MRALIRNKIMDVARRYAQWYILYPQRYDYLIDKALNSTEPGVSDNHSGDRETVVSLTTYGRRLYEVSAAIESIMQGSVKPDRIVLWLNGDLKDTVLPITLQRQMNRGLEISYCNDIKAYKKLIPSLRKFPEADIITIDDDLIYYYDLVEKLVAAHRTYPDCIIANRFARIVLGHDGHPLPYRKWKMEYWPEEVSPLNFFTGGGGTLYPSGCFDDEVLNEDVFTDICPSADDVWFNAMALKAGTPVIKCFTHEKTGSDYLTNMALQSEGLCRTNAGDLGNANDTQLRAVFDRYNLWHIFENLT